MAILIGNVTAGNVAGDKVTLTVSNIDADAAVGNGDPKGVGKFVGEAARSAGDGNDKGMKVAFIETGTSTYTDDDVHEVLSFDVSAGTVTLKTTTDRSDGDLYKLYEGAHGTEQLHQRKRLLGYI